MARKVGRIGELWRVDSFTQPSQHAVPIENDAAVWSEQSSLLGLRSLRAGARSLAQCI